MFVQNGRRKVVRIYSNLRRNEGKPEKTKIVMNIPSASSLKQMQSLSGKLDALNRSLSKSAERAIPCLDILKKCTNKKDFCWTETIDEAFKTMKRLVAELLTLTTNEGQRTDGVFFTTDESVSAVLLIERNGKHMSIHYPGDVRKASQVGRRVWSICHIIGLKKHDKRTSLADFLANTVTKGNPVRENIPDAEEVPESSTARDALVVSDLMPEPEMWKLYTDGASNDHGSEHGLS
nr:hypothetical protein [Tanacetum cinerariifolium]